MNEMN